MISNTIEVKRTEDGQVFVSKGTWSDTFSEDRRLSWAQWYEQMHQTYAYEGYAEMAKALRELPA